MINITDKLNELRADSTEPQPRPIINRDSIKKFYIEPDTKTRVLDKKSFVEFVAETTKTTTTNALSLIKSSRVTVNKNIIVDENYELNSGDVVRSGVLGHFLQGPDNIAIVK
jgi:protein involved in polysaccharide export with SLBB domain